jgi:hypothetical protein
MKLRGIHFATFLTVVALALPACAGASHREEGDTCRIDSECATDFCDSGHCAVPQGSYGARCQSAARTVESLRDARIETCGAYLCIEQRCRSCTSDAQCAAELGAPLCKASEGRPGLRCGR